MAGVSLVAKPDWRSRAGMVRARRGWAVWQEVLRGVGDLGLL